MLRCAGVASESHLPFAGLHQILRPAIQAMPALSRLHQEALNGALGLSGRRGVDPFLVGVAALSLLGELAGDSALTCLVDDAQWLDPSSADVLRFVARRLDAEGVLMVFTVRDPDEADFDAPGTAGAPAARARRACLVVAAPRPGSDDLRRGQGHGWSSTTRATRWRSSSSRPC